jgi:hypothetical protein
MKHILPLLALLLFAQAPAPALAQQAARFTYSADGQEVTDQATGLIWRRCAEGMAWASTTCTGSALNFTHENALTRAKTEATASGKAWRLPNVKELSSLVDRAHVSPAIDVAAFPATPSSWFWSSSPYAGDSGDAWYVLFSDGFVNRNYRNVSYAVRLVRASQ